MPISRKKQCSIPNTRDTTEGQSAPPLPDQQTFRQYLRDLARGAIRVVLEGVMREELDALIGVGWGESGVGAPVGEHRAPDRLDHDHDDTGVQDRVGDEAADDAAGLQRAAQQLTEIVRRELQTAGTMSRP